MSTDAERDAAEARELARLQRLARVALEAAELLQAALRQAYAAQDVTLAVSLLRGSARTFAAAALRLIELA